MICDDIIALALGAQSALEGLLACKALFVLFVSGGGPKKNSSNFKFNFKLKFKFNLKFKLPVLKPPANSPNESA